MKLTPGEIYFIRELDVHTGKETQFVKIGLVREKKGEERASEDRALEHQTGNPRKLFVESVIHTPAVSEIENILHHLHADDRVYGEWFEFTEEKFALVKQSAQDLADTASTNHEKFKIAASLGGKQSTKELLKPSEEASNWHKKLLSAESRKKECSALQQEIKNAFISELLQPKNYQEQIEKQEKLSPFVNMQEVKLRPKFDLKAFALSRPELYEEFSRVKMTEPKGSFLITRPKNLDLSLSTIDSGLFQYAEFARTTLADYKTGKSTEMDLHTVTLKLRGFEAKADWDKEIALVNLKVLCKENAGIEGICKWTRQPKEEKFFDEDAFLQAHPRIAAQYMVDGGDRRSVVVEKRRAYPHYKKKK
jgi:hypothetical protein